MYGAIPIYKKTSDQRILQYMRENARIHELKTGKSTVGRLHLISNIKTNKKWWQLWK